MSEIKVNSIKGVGASAAAITVNNTDGTCTANITNNLSNRNMVINGSMVCSQRGSSFASITDAYCLDRFTFRNNNGVAGTFTVSQSTETPDGFGNSLKVAVGTADSALAAGESFLISTRLEGQNLQSLAKGTSSAKKSVLSFYVKTNKTGTYAVFIYDNDNTRQFSTTYTVSNTNWNRYTIDVPADTTGAFDNDNGRSLDIYWYLGAGTNSTSGTLASSWQSYVAADSAVGQVNFADSTSNEFYITGIQYEVNESGVATDFEHRSFGQELQLCKRYYQEYKNIQMSGYIPDNNARAYGLGFNFPVEMRAAPTLTISNTGSSSGQTISTGDLNANITSLLSQGTTTYNAEINVNVSQDLTDNRPAVASSAGYSVRQTKYMFNGEL
jgi:hypothetical protein